MLFIPLSFVPSVELKVLAMCTVALRAADRTRGKPWPIPWYALRWRPGAGVR